jgi:hypothetical protein
MKWSNKEYKPKGGETRTYRRFAWKPIAIDTWIIWLETYQVTEQYIGGNWVQLEAIYGNVRSPTL